MICFVDEFREIIGDHGALVLIVFRVRLDNVIPAGLALSSAIHNRLDRLTVQLGET